MSEKQTPKTESEKDSFEIPMKKNPIFLYAVINIGIVSFMVGLFYLAYQNLKQQ